MNFIHKIGKFYQKAMMKNIGIFIFAGLMMVFFGENGWFPNQELSEIANLVYAFILPIMVAYECGAKIGDSGGAVAAVIAMTGILTRNENVGFFGAMIIGPLVGLLWKKAEGFLKESGDFRMKMLIKNLSVAAVGGILSLVSYFFVVPLLETGMVLIRSGIEILVKNHLVFALSIIIEPAKVFFLNNLVNHAILVPLGMEQLRSAGSSMLFLAEANPGPGFGILLALLLMKRHEKNEIASAMVAQAGGGIHEVYFPFVLSELKLLIPLILGGMAGNAYFSLMNAGVQGAVSPGSILIVLLMAGKSEIFHVLIGVVLSAVISCGSAMAILAVSGKRTEAEISGTMKNVEFSEENVAETEETVVQEVKKEKIDRIAVVCDGGVGSSVMGAALLRRSLMAKQVSGVTVEAFAVDLVPEDVKVILCQKDYYQCLPENLKGLEIHTVDNLVQRDGFSEIIEEIIKRNS